MRLWELALGGVTQDASLKISWMRFGWGDPRISWVSLGGVTQGCSAHRAQGCLENQASEY